MKLTTQLDLRPTSYVPKRIVFHYDFDGVCSAAILVKFFSAEVELEPVNYSLKRKWLSRNMATSAVVDFLFHPDALWWFDHHVTTFVNDKVRRQYAPSPRHRWDTSYEACPSLILDVLAESTDVSELRSIFAEWTRWSIIIDSAKYDSPVQAVLGEEPCILINQALSESDSPDLRRWLVSRIAAGLKPEDLAFKPQVRELWERFRRRQAAALDIMERRLRRIGSVGLCDVTDCAVPLVRYALYLFQPDLSYSVIAYNRGRGKYPYHISVGRNPWKRMDSQAVNLGALALRYGGGGRESVASIQFKTASECRRALEEIARILASDATSAHALANSE
jgi:hypothetical protein